MCTYFKTYLATCDFAEDITIVQYAHVKGTVHCIQSHSMAKSLMVCIGHQNHIRFNQMHDTMT